MAHCLSIIIANLPESTEGTVEDRRKDDRDRVRVLVGKITDVPSADIDDPIRLGPLQVGTRVRPRLLKMVVRTEGGKEKIMKNVFALNEGVPFEERVYINNDCTPREREQYRTLKTELIRRKENGEADIVIRNMKIVKRQNTKNGQGAMHAPR